MSEADQPGDLTTVQIADVLDALPFSGYQRLALVLTGLAVIMDGLDNRLLPLTIPPLLIEWGISREAFALATSIGLAGMVIGTTLGGMIGDRIGRRPTMIGSLLLFGVVTTATGMVTGMSAMIATRFVAGLGLGALMPSAASMFAELTPAPRRTLAVTIGMVCVPIGGVLSGFLGAAILPVLGWRALFAVGGVLAVVIALLLYFLLPESPRYLARQEGCDERLRATLLRMGANVPSGRIVETSGEAKRRAALMRLFERPLALDTVGLWGAFLFVLMALYMESQWMPMILTDNGYPIETASIASSCLAFGGMFASVFGVYALARFGSRAALMTMAAGAVALTLGLSQYPMNPDESALPLLVLLTIVGFLVGGLQIMIYSIATHAYPTSLRSTGIGWAVGIGRIGSVISPFVATGGLALGGYRVFFIFMAGAMTCVFLSLWAIRHHVPRRVRAGGEDSC